MLETTDSNLWKPYTSGQTYTDTHPNRASDKDKSVQDEDDGLCIALGLFNVTFVTFRRNEKVPRQIVRRAGKTGRGCNIDNLN